jgi:branched-chain amino acid transport system substrate-binding protein
MKPAEITPLSSLRIAELMAEAGLPPGVVNMLPGLGSVAGQYIAEHPEIAKIAFTGSTATGRRIVQASAGNLKKVQLELGGKGPNIVFEDANLQAAVNGSAWAIFHNQGQACIAGSRLMLHEKIADAFLEQFIPLAKSIRLGDPLDEATEMGPLTSAQHRERVLSHVEVAQGEGGELLAGGKSPGGDLAKGCYVEPTVMRARSYKDRIAQEEVFGPFVTVLTFKNDEEAMQIANGTDYGLGSGLWTNNLQRAHKVARDLHAGMVWINSYKRVNPGSPFGGVGQSGYGREMGFDAMRAGQERVGERRRADTAALRALTPDRAAQKTQETETTMTFNRRQFTQATAALVASGATPLVFAADTLKIGYVSPQTGPLAPFGEADKWVIDQMKTAFKDGISVGGKKYAVQIVLKDSQSNPNRAGEVANDLILKDKVALVLTAGTPETANPVSDACELNEVPCISSVVPWQPWFFGRKGDPAKGFNWTYHMFWGLEDVIANFTNGWKTLATNKKVGGLFPNDGDGNAWGDKELGFPKPLAQMGFTLTDPGRFQNGTQDFSAQIAAFKKEGVEIVTGVVIPPDAKTFLTQARQQGFKPKIITLGKALLFPGAIEALGDLGDGLSTEVWWSPSHPFTSSLTQQSAKVLADAYEAGAKKQWTQPIGFAHALFEVAANALGRAKSLKASDVRDAVASTSINSVVGPVKWGGQGPFKNVSKTPLVLGQWGKGQKYKVELTIVNNEAATNIPAGGKLRLL